MLLLLGRRAPLLSARVGAGFWIELLGDWGKPQKLEVDTRRKWKEVFWEMVGNDA